MRGGMRAIPEVWTAPINDTLKTTIFGYEIEAYPYYNNAVVYHRDFTGEMFRSAVDGDVTAQELKSLLDREDMIVIPHDTYHLESGVDFEWIDPKLFTPLIEIYSRGDSAEYFDNPQNIEKVGMCRPFAVLLILPQKSNQSQLVDSKLSIC